MTKEYSFVADTSGLRLDKFVWDRWSELSRTHAKKLIADGFITVNGLAAKASLSISSGDKVNIVIPSAPPSPLSPEEMPLDIIYEDDDCFAVLSNKMALGHIEVYPKKHFSSLKDVPDELVKHLFF